MTTNAPDTRPARRHILGMGAALGAAAAVLTVPGARAEAAAPRNAGDPSATSGHTPGIALEQGHAGFPAMPRAVLEFFLASQRADADAWAATFTPQGVFHDPVGQPPLVGREAIRKRIHSILPSFRPFLGITPNEAHMTADFVAVSWRGAAVTLKNRPVNWSGINIFQLDDKGLIKEAWAYFNYAAFKVQLDS
ncbi:nuclear transport factor 2 family protein [Streptomyces sp. NPDC006530]|uniref:nuclear transport factor 2 family protein n=1 Tax=Streptomyces sp. NPDC006530 TaxID=3364750 RepID=UPI0036C17DC8